MTITQKNLRILVVDDSIVFRMMISDVIADIHGMEIVGTARDGASALAKTASLKPDLVTLDIEMPGMNGLEVLTTLRSRFPRTEVIMISSDAGRGDQRIITSLEAGAFDFILKPSEENMVENKRKLEKTLRLCCARFPGEWKSAPFWTAPGPMFSKPTDVCPRTGTRTIHAGQIGEHSSCVPKSVRDCGHRGIHRRTGRISKTHSGVACGSGRTGPHCSAHAPRIHPGFGGKPGPAIQRFSDRSPERGSPGCRPCIHRSRRKSHENRISGKPIPPNDPHHPGPAGKRMPAVCGLPIPVGGPSLQRPGHWRHHDGDGSGRGQRPGINEGAPGGHHCPG